MAINCQSFLFCLFHILGWTERSMEPKISGQTFQLRAIFQGMKTFPAEKCAQFMCRIFSVFDEVIDENFSSIFIFNCRFDVTK